MYEFLETVSVGVVVGVVSGVVSSSVVARLFYLRSLLDRSSEQLKRCCPYRRENVRQGDGLDETAWSLNIHAELLQTARFRRAAAAMVEVAAEMQELPTLTEPSAEQKAARDNIKRRWQQKVASLYKMRSWWWEV